MLFIALIIEDIIKKKLSIIIARILQYVIIVKYLCGIITDA